MSIESDYFQQTVAMIKEHWFPKHVASIVKYEVTIWRATDPPIHSLIWAKPGTSTCLVRYLLLNSTLIVTGDIGSAIYRWGHDKDMGFEWIAKCDFQYFASKIEGLNRGESREWNPDVCEQRAREFFEGQRNEDWTPHTGFSEEWRQFVGDNQKLFDGWEGCSDAASWGLVPSNRCIGHWVGLRLAMGVEKP
jgi:hypothetical protein